MIDEILNSKVKVRVLNLLVSRPEWIFSETEMARELNIPKATLHRNAKNLSDSGVLLRYKKGRTVIYRLDKSNYIVQKLIIPLFRKEAAIPIEIAKEFCRELKPVIKVGVVFGSASEGRMKPRSDIDIAIISDKMNELEKKAAVLKKKYLQNKGVIISTHLFRTKNFKARYKKDPYIRGITHGKVICGDLKKVI